MKTLIDHPTLAAALRDASSEVSRARTHTERKCLAHYYGYLAASQTEMPADEAIIELGTKIPEKYRKDYLEGVNEAERDDVLSDELDH